LGLFHLRERSLEMVMPCDMQREDRHELPSVVPILVDGLGIQEYGALHDHILPFLRGEAALDVQVILTLMEDALLA